MGLGIKLLRSGGVDSKLNTFRSPIAGLGRQLAKYDGIRTRVRRLL